jgi:hypothetical protein
MARVPGSDIYEIRVVGAGPVAAKFSRAERAIQDELIAVLRELQTVADRTFDSLAPEDTGQTKTATQTVLSFRAAEPRLSVRRLDLIGHGNDPRDYFDVPRFGHREGRIFPRGKALKVHLWGHRNPHLYEFRAWVTGVGHPHPDLIRHAARTRQDMRAFRASFRPHDWVEEAAQRIERDIDAAAARLGRRIEARLS